MLDAAKQPGLSPAQLLSAARRNSAAPKAGSAFPVRYTVRPGDSLSAIAGHFYHDPAAWPVLYWRNHGQVHWADIIEAGQVLRIPAKAGPDTQGTRAAEPRPAAPGLYAATCAPGSGAGAGAAQADPAQAAPVAAASAYSGGTPGGAFGQCVVARESGGDAQVMNSTGHYGLYQFSASTWAAYGGDPADFGNASVAEQNQVFATALARGGQDNWAPYDGC